MSLVAFFVGFGQSLGHAGSNLLHFRIFIRLLLFFEFPHEFNLLRLLRSLRKNHGLDRILQIINQVLDALALHFGSLEVFVLVFGPL